MCGRAVVLFIEPQTLIGDLQDLSIGTGVTDNAVRVNRVVNSLREYYGRAIEPNT